MGGIWINENEGWDFVNDFHDLCIKELDNCPTHMKWSKVTSHPIYKKYYKFLVDLYFKYNNQNKMFFKTIIVDDDYQFTHNKYNDGDYEVGFYKLYFQMIKTTFESNKKYHLRIADRTVSRKTEEKTEKDRLKDLKRCLNRHAIKITNRPFCRLNNRHPVLTVEPRRACKKRLIQLADILMGAVGYHWNNEHEKENTKKSKIWLANYISEKLNKNNLKFTSSRLDNQFNIFYMQPK